MSNKTISQLEKKDLLKLIDIYAKNWLAMDGVWFQSIEKKFGMDEAVEHDQNAWKDFTVIEAKRIKVFLNLPEKAGIDGLKKALAFRMYANINEDEIIIEDNVLIYKTLDCRVQNARKRKGMEFHPCKSVGIIEYSYFAKTIDDRFACEALSCYPEITDDTCNCSWKFTLQVDQ
ncbi:hypothetical protein J0B03_11700 [Alkalibacter rhizosphaerae]|uniref:Uncharacterized protein n=1 Tax=Alkalibacter rhizosphaerae TaxID=2815577 RepID=A0A975AHG7_9FIRM|nr:DUF6125 family protein [Alkalibacter rhizosphaerae]QSX08437.1 hypothetical protein J0B03_11700 [Alkalibacter rhizosphaerae]